MYLVLVVSSKTVIIIHEVYKAHVNLGGNGIVCENSSHYDPNLHQRESDCQGS